MSTCNDGNTVPDLYPRTGKDLVVGHNKCSRVNIIVWGLHKEQLCWKCVLNLGLESFVRGNVLWERNHIRLVLMKKDSNSVSSELVKQVSEENRVPMCHR